MREEHPFIGDGDHVIVEGAGGDRFFRLLDEEAAGRVQAMQPRHRLARFDMLARGEGPARLAVDEDFNAGQVVPFAQAHMIGRAFIAKGRRHGIMHGKSARVGEGEAQLGQRLRPFMAAMRHGDEVGDGQMRAAVPGIGGGRYRRGIGGPHGGSRHSGRADMRLCLGDIGAQAREPLGIGAPLREEQPLPQAQLDVAAHLFQPLQRGGARLRHGAGVARGGEIAEAKAGIVVAGADQPVEIDFGDAHARPAMVKSSPIDRPMRAALWASSEMAPSALSWIKPQVQR